MRQGPHDQIVGRQRLRALAARPLDLGAANRGVQRAGDFSAVGRPIIDPFTQQPFPGNIIPASRMSAAGINAANLYPRENTSVGSANYVSSPEGERDSIQFTIKTDFNGLTAGEAADKRMFATATLLPDQDVLLVGGYGPSVQASSRAWLIHVP